MSNIDITVDVVPVHVWFPFERGLTQGARLNSDDFRLRRIDINITRYQLPGTV